MFSVISDQQTQRSTWNPRLIINRVGRSASSFVAVGVLIGTLDATISQPGIVPWIIVMAGFGIIVGVLGGRAIDVLTAASAAAVVCFAGVFIASGSDSPTADAVASGLLLGSIAGGFFRPWLKVSVGLISLIRFMVRGAKVQVFRTEPEVTEPEIQVRESTFASPPLRLDFEDSSSRKAS